MADQMKKRFSFLLALLGLFGGAKTQAAPVETILPELPRAVQEKTNFVLEVQTILAAGVMPPQMHVELKRGNIVLQSHQQQAATGRHRFSFTIPAQHEAPEIHFAIWYGETWTNPVVPILFTAPIRVMTTEEATQREEQRRYVREWRQKYAPLLAEGPLVGVLFEEGMQRPLAERLLRALTAEGLQPVPISAQELCNESLISPDNIGTLILTQSRALPVASGRVVENYLSASGRLIALGTPGFVEGVALVEGQWLTAPQIKKRLEKEPGFTRILYDFESGSAQDWSFAGASGAQGRWEYVAGGANGTKTALHCIVPDFRNWNTFIAPAVKQPFREQEMLTCFWAKGAPQTTALAVEWAEQDGSRWIATVSLGVEWRFYVLAPEDFIFWPYDHLARHRGKPGDSFQPLHAAKLTFSLAKSHTPLADGFHEFWLDEIGVGVSPVKKNSWPGKISMAPIELLTPGYKFHRVTTAKSLRVSAKQTFLPLSKLKLPKGLMSVQPRPQATGFEKQRKWRWIPLLEAFDASGEVCGTPAALMLFYEGPYQGAQIASFCLPPEAYDEQMLRLVAQLARRMQQGIYLQEGGAQFYAYFRGETIQLGARTISFPHASEKEALNGAQVRFRVTSTRGVEFERLLPLKDNEVRLRFTPRNSSPHSLEVSCWLVDNKGRVWDGLSHPVLIWEPSPQPQFMEIRHGEFFLSGRPWRPIGVNYMPSSGIGIEDVEYFEYWLDSQPYDPIIIQRDLQRIAGMGLNMISIFCYYRSLPSRNLLDILERCRRLGLKVNLSLRPGTPLDFRWEEMKAIIQAYRLAENDTIFAYDLAWEPTFGRYNARRGWDSEWERWINERYGCLENAERDWGMPAPRLEGKITGPSDEQLRTEGAHRVFVCAYRRFLDDLLAKKHAIANGLVKSIDPHHFTSFRMSIAGDPTAAPEAMAYDFRGLARSCDIMEPEAYGRIGDWPHVRIGRFTADYARAVAPGRPVMWAEFGIAPYGPEALDISPTRLHSAAEFYRLFFRMLQESNAQGAVCWWYPGGYRVGESSDYGIINPDGSWRPVSYVIAEWARIFTKARPQLQVDEWLVFDRDATTRGLQGIYDMLKERYWQIVDKGGNPGLRSIGFGRDSATVPSIAVGNVPYRPGQNPHKYLNAEFDFVQILNAENSWQNVHDKAVVHIKRGAPLRLRAQIGNLGEATWRGMESFTAVSSTETMKGLVGLICNEAFSPLPQDVPYMGTALIEARPIAVVQQPLEIVLEMGVLSPHIRFGEKIHVHLAPE